MELGGNKCHACAIEEESQIMELRLETASRQSILGNIYVGQVENIASNIQAAFVLKKNKKSPPESGELIILLLKTEQHNNIISPETVMAMMMVMM